MSSIATCPQCSAQLAVPETASANDQAQCPECWAEFSLAEADLRYLLLAKIVEPAQATPPADPPAAIEPERDKPSLTAGFVEKGLPERVLPETFRSAETISATSTLSGWEERLRTAIDSTEMQSDGEPEIADPPLPEEASTEKSPEFEFELDPPAESPTGNFASAATKLPETRDWFKATSEQSSSEQTAEESRATAVHAPAADAPMATKRATPPQRRKKNSLLKRATVVVLLGAVGVLLGQYALFWLRGRSADYLHVAQFVPSAIFPSVQSQVFVPRISREEKFVSDSVPIEKSEIEEPAQELLAETEPAERETAERDLAPPAKPQAVTHDDFVRQATIHLPEVGLIPPTSTTAADFELLLGIARDSARVLVEGDLSTQESVRGKGRAYMALCRLAERFDFVRAANLDDDTGNEVENRAGKLASSAQSLFRTTAEQTATRYDLALIVARWWQHQTRPNQGVFFVGRIQDIEAMGSRTLCQVAVVHAAESIIIPVLLPNAAYQIGDQIGVVGTIVAKPRTVIPGFTADLPQLAVAVDSFSVPAD